ncbi:carotenoid biosynthesis protein [Puia sp.]|uniref:carotenoid biosynthesis protein n=1 Tax=Puia sp. TaxID=2045100 RepID=UPI002F3E2F50
MAETSLYVLFLFCFLHARKKGPTAVAYLLGGVLFGLVLEYMEVMIGNYTYGRFWVMLGRNHRDIPLCIGVAWGIIMYSARLLTDWLGLPLWAAAAFDTLLALNIDFSIDVVAYRMHMWHWDWSYMSANPLTAQWFGVPFGNFFGWQTVVFCYSAFSRLFAGMNLRRETGAIKNAFTTFLAINCSLVVLFTSEEKISPKLAHFGITSAHRVLLMCAFLFALVAYGWRHRHIVTGSLPGIARVVPFWFHLLFAAFFFALGFYSENTAMTLAVIINFAIGALLHALPVLSASAPRSALNARTT